MPCTIDVFEKLQSLKEVLLECLKGEQEQEQEEEQPRAQEQEEEQPRAQEQEEEQPRAQEQEEEQPRAQGQEEEQQRAQEQEEEQPRAHEQEEEQPRAQEQVEEHPRAQEQEEEQPRAQEREQVREEDERGEVKKVKREQEPVEPLVHCAPDARGVASEGGSSESVTSSQGRSLPFTGRGDEVTDDGLTTGGCDARALHHLGVFPSEAAAVASLDHNIPIIHALPTFADKPEREVGVRGDQWCHEVLFKTVTGAGWHFFKLNTIYGGKELKDLDLESILKSKHGRFFVDGYLNNRGYTRGKKRESITVKDPLGLNAYRHSTPVVEGTILDHGSFVRSGKMPASMFHLHRAVINKKKGYFSRFARIYKLFECKCPGQSCKGSCISAIDRYK